jgi:hypothetical protein
MAQEAPTDVFKRANVDFMLLGITRVTWEMARHFHGRPPLNFQLQRALTGSRLADDWEDVPGAAGVNVFTLSDEQDGLRAIGKQLTVHYRVELTDGDGVVSYSSPASSEGGLTKFEWLEAREILFRESFSGIKFSSCNGWLLKAKRHGAPCPVCLDPDTGEVTTSHCPTCKGTRWTGGYYAAIPATYAEITENPIRMRRDMQQNRGTVYDDVKKGRFLGLPQLYAYDVWIDAESDERYYLHEINVIAKLRAVPLIYDVELRQVEFNEVVYTIPLEGS